MGPKSGPSKDLYIYVAFSVAGGTGTGIYYDILHLLEEKVRSELSDLNTYIFPLVLLPKAFEDAQLDSAYKNSELNGGFAISDLAQLDIDNDVDECQVALSPKVVLNRLKCSTDISDPIPSEKKGTASKRR